uniref:Cyclin D-type binding-protein 1 n=1 Tax=Amphilophus citrinellus TaxID=61819 RepID=A0A3Q0T575_AMPCI
MLSCLGGDSQCWSASFVFLYVPLSVSSSLSQEQLMSTGGVWSACDHFSQLSKDNKAAVVRVLTSQTGVVKDAIEEIEQAQDPFDDILDDDQEGDEPRGNQDTYWSEKDRRVIGACQGLMKASVACLRKLSSAVRANGDFSTPQNVSQLDDLADISKEISPGVDDLALCLYPPMDYSGVETHVRHTLSHNGIMNSSDQNFTKSCHVCGESELTWVQFLDGAVDHNLQKTKDLIEQDS